MGVIATPVAEAHALDAGRLQPLIRHLGLSLGDLRFLRFCRAPRLSPQGASSSATSASRP